MQTLQSPQTEQWYCVHTRPKKEANVEAYCREQLGLETYFPRLRQQRVIRRVRRVVTGPLFPRYLFCRFDPAVSYRQVKFAPDAIDLVHSGARPAVVAATLIDEIKRWAGEAYDVLAYQPPLRPGDRVEITAGPMRGLTAVILNTHDDRDRVAILLSILECGAQMSISRANLRRAC